MRKEGEKYDRSGVLLALGWPPGFLDACVLTAIRRNRITNSRIHGLVLVKLLSFCDSKRFSYRSTPTTKLVGGGAQNLKRQRPKVGAWLLRAAECARRSFSVARRGPGPKERLASPSNLVRTWKGTSISVPFRQIAKKALEEEKRILVTWK